MEIITLLSGVIIGILGLMRLIPSKEGKILAETQTKIHQILETSKKEASQIRHDTKTNLQDIVQYEQDENKRMENHVNRLEEALKLKEKHTKERLDKTIADQNLLQTEKETILALKKSIEDQKQESINLLLKKTTQNYQEIVQEIIEKLTQDYLKRKDRFLKRHLENLEEDSSKLAKNILTETIQRYGAPSSVDHSTTLIEVKNEKFKAVLVGKEAENINYLEEKAEVTIIFNDAPKTITVTGNHLLKRQIVKWTIEHLQKIDKPITPSTIDDALKKGETKTNEIMQQIAEKILKRFELENAPPEIKQYIGRLYFRTSYGQNVLKHSIEVGMFAGLIAAAVGANVKVARLAGFLHDIGKAISEESDKGHDHLTKEILEKYNYPEEVIHAAWAHHEAVPTQSLEAKIIMAADALSASRPGARLESLDRYLKRIKALESTAASFPGIKKTFAISAGREVRVVVQPQQISDKDLKTLAHNIAQKIETDLTYPGNIKVNVIRRLWWSAKTKTMPESSL